MSEIQLGSPLCLTEENQLNFYEKEDKLREGGIHYVLWSGGCDSTLLLYELLDRYGSENVVAISYKYPWLLKTKAGSEENHRNAFIAKMKLRGEKFSNFRHTVFEISQETLCGNTVNVYSDGLPQAVGWLLSIPTYVVSGSYVYDGGIRTDDLSLVMAEYHDLFKSVTRILKRDLILRQPYIYYNKSQIIQKLIHYGIYEETWFCEDPNEVGVPCGECHPCKRHLEGLTVMSINSDNDHIVQCAKNELDKLQARISKGKEL